MTCTRPCTCPACLAPHTPARRAQAAWWLREACGCPVCIDAQERALKTTVAVVDERLEELDDE